MKSLLHVCVAGIPFDWELGIGRYASELYPSQANHIKRQKWGRPSMKVLIQDHNSKGSWKPLTSERLHFTGTIDWTSAPEQGYDSVIRHILGV